MSTLASLMVGLGLSATDYVKGLDTAEKKTATSAASIGAKLAAIGGKAIFAGAVAGVGAVVGAVVGGIKAVGDWASTLDNLGDVLGTNAQESAALAVAIQGVGGNVEGIASQMTILTRGLVDAKGEIGPTGKILDSLGISFQDANGNMLPTTDILTSVADKLAAMPDGLQKTALMTDLFGKSGKDLSDVMNALADGGLTAAGEKAARLGLLLGDDTVNASIEAGKQFATLKMALQGVFVTIGAKLLPILSPLLAWFTTFATKAAPKVGGWITRIANWIQSALVPVIERLASGFQYLVGVFQEGGLGQVFTAFEDGSSYIQNFLEKLGMAEGPAGRLGLAISWVGRRILEVAGWITANWQPILIGAVAFILGFLIPAFIAWATAAWTAAVATITALAPVVLPILLIAAAVGLLAAAWQNNWGGIQEKAAAAWAAIQPVLQQLWVWLQVNIPVALQWLSSVWQTVLLPAIQKVWTWVQKVAFPIILDLVAWLQVNIPAAIAILKNFWETVLLPAIQKVWIWIQTVAFPLAQQLVAWLQVNIPAAIQTLTNYWNNTLLPALNAVWAFVQNYLFPLFNALADFFNAAMSLALTALAGLWQNVLQPALRDVWEFISTNLQPVLDFLAAFFKDTLGPNIQTVKTNVLDKLPGVFKAIRDAIQWVIDKIVNLTNKLNNIDLPGWLTPGSPTPFEMGLRGIGEALEDLARMQLPQLAASLDLNAAVLPGSGAAPGSESVINIQPGAIIIQAYPGVNAELLARQILEYIAREKRMGQNSGLLFSTTG